MSALAKLDAMKPWVSASVWNDLLDVRAELERLQRDVMRQSLAVIDLGRPEPLPYAPIYSGPAPVSPGFPVTQDEE